MTTNSKIRIPVLHQGACYYLHPQVENGLLHGIPMEYPLHKIDLKEDGAFVPTLRINKSFSIACDSRPGKRPDVKSDDYQVRVVNAQLKPDNNSFLVFSKPDPGIYTATLLARLSVEMKKQYWFGVHGYNCALIKQSSGRVILEFTKKGQYADLYFGNADVKRVTYDGKRLKQECLSGEEVIQLRIEQASHMLTRKDIATSTKEGVLNQMVRLLMLCNQRENILAMKYFFVRQFGLDKRLQYAVGKVLEEKREADASLFLTGKYRMAGPPRGTDQRRARSVKMKARKKADQERTAKTKGRHPKSRRKPKK